MTDDRDDIRRTFQALATGAFPDNPDVDWRIRSIVQQSEFFCVEAEPAPPTVGYPRFRFVLARSASGSFQDHACYCLDQGAWTLMYTTPNTGGGWRSLGFERAD